MKTIRHLLPACFVAMLTTMHVSSMAQQCSSLAVRSVSSESRCMSTGAINVTASGGSGAYNYKVSGPVNTAYTSSSAITGLSAGTYLVTVKDITTGCVAEQANVVVTGTYAEPRFTLAKTDETCANAQNGTVSVSGVSGGRAPFMYTIVAPSPMGIGTASATGQFTGLSEGEYAIQMRDSCGGIQTRRIRVLGYDWWIDAFSGNRNNCTNADFSFTLRDSRGNTSLNSTVFSGFRYGVVRSTGDTAWFSSRNFTYNIGTRRSLVFVVRDGCGNVRQRSWNVNPVPAAANAVTTSQTACNVFTASITGQSGLTNPQYSLFRQPGTLVSTNSTGSFSGFPGGSYYILIRDNCFDTTIRRDFAVSRPRPSLGASVNTNRITCSTFNASVSGMTNFTSPTYRLFNGANVLLATQSNGNFNNLLNGSYCIRVQDGCYDTIISRCFTVDALVPSVNAAVTISGQGCNTASVSVGGQTNLSNPQFCLFNAANVQVACNGNGTFNNVPYGSYCIRIVNSAACYDTTIRRCFTITRPIPSLSASLNVTRNCGTISLAATGQANLNNPQYCLYNAANTLIGCNGSGNFNNLPYGTYCMEIRNDPSCYDTVIRRCVTVTRNVPSIGAVSISNQACSTFSATVASQVNLSNPVFQLRNLSGVLLASNGSGIFNNLAYGSYRVTMVNNAACYDTSIVRDFSVNRPVASAGPVALSGYTCSGFNADFTGEVNVSSATYRLVNELGQVIATNTSGTFTGIPYGTYSIRMYVPCYDTTIIRGFTGNPIAINTMVSAQAGCEVNATSIRVQFVTGFAPYTITVYDPSNQVVASYSGSANPVVIPGLDALPAGLQYRVVARDNCGASDTKRVTPVVHAFSTDISVQAKCPSGTFQNGSSDMIVQASSTLGPIYPVIIRKNAASVTIDFTNQSGSQFTWIDLEPATYVIMYNLPGSCTNKAYDTVTVSPYAYPALNRSAAYQCDNNSFSVGASVTGGSAPFSYQIIGSQPVFPSINTAPQSSPVFQVTNGQTYSLVRLRAIDACGNATLNDVSILPLANLVVSASSTCYYTQVRLSVDSMANASYAWYKRLGAADSVLVSSGQSHDIPYLLPTDTGTYIAKVTVNDGCLTKLSYFRLEPSCGTLLPAAKLTLGGRTAGTAAELHWDAEEEKGVREYLVQRSSRGGQYHTIGSVAAKRNGAPGNRYAFRDEQPDAGSCMYRLRAVDDDGRAVFSNIVVLQWSGTVVRVYPNPVTDHFYVDVQTGSRTNVAISLHNASGQQVLSRTLQHVQAQRIRFARNGLSPGVYTVCIKDLDSGRLTTEKIVLQ